MFLIMGTTNGKKDIEYQRMIICPFCGSYGRYSVFMTYSAFTLFFIPLFKFNRRFFVRTSCCGTLCELDKETGKSLLRGEDIEIRPELLTKISSGIRRCPSCGCEVSEGFSFCPGCGNKL